MAKARPGVVDAGENGRERRDGVQAGEQQQAGENRDREPVEQHEGQHGRHGPAFHGPAVDAHRTDRMRVQHCYKLVLRLFDQQDGADHLDPAPRRPGRRRESRQQQHGQRREQGPLRKVGIGVAGGGGHGNGVEHAVAQGLQRRAVDALHARLPGSANRRARYAGGTR
ncbi:hypothetical protein G6F59_015021 [Rhizopus arrhizus]|nr:hypothetical protein G6F59_015021 [Rhizopus arrhizus]